MRDVALGRNSQQIQVRVSNKNNVSASDALHVIFDKFSMFIWVKCMDMKQQIISMEKYTCMDF